MWEDQFNSINIVNLKMITKIPCKINSGLPIKFARFFRTALTLTIC